MKKDTLLTFMRRYSLAGLVPKVKWKYDPIAKTLHTRAVADGRAFVVDVVLNNFDEMGVEELLLCIGDTEKVRVMMSPYGEDINLTINKVGDRLLGFTLSDKDCESYCTAVDPTAMDPVAKNLQDLPECQVEVPLTEDFITKFMAARKALDDVDTFSVGMNKKGLFEIVLGYATSNSNRIRLTPTCDPEKNKLSVALTFPLKYIFAILKANEDIPDGVMSIHDGGIIQLRFKNDKFTCNYYQFCKKKQ